MAHKNRPKYVEKQLKSINNIFRAERLKYNERYTNDLWTWFVSYLLDHDWYRGFNMHKDVVREDGSIYRALAGVDYEKEDYYLQIW